MADPEDLKIRIGFGLGTVTAAAGSGAFAELVDSLEDGGWDSLWLSEQLGGPAPDPLTALVWAERRTQRIKFGTAVSVLPGRNPVVLAKQVATLDRLSGGRFPPAVGLGAVRPVEQTAFGVRRAERAEWFDEALPLMRRLRSEHEVSHSGARFSVESLTLGPRPVQQPLGVWLGGRPQHRPPASGRAHCLSVTPTR